MKAISATVALTFIVSLSVANAADKPPPKKKAEGTSKVKSPSITVPSFGALPSSEGIVAPKAEQIGQDTKSTALDATYEVVAVQHAKGFAPAGKGHNAIGGYLAQVALAGEPPKTEKFSTLVRVRSPKKVSTAIDVVILDPRGDTVMSASGEVPFNSKSTDEVDYLIDWNPTPWPKGGEFSVLVRIGGKPMGTWPLKVAR